MLEPFMLNLPASLVKLRKFVKTNFLTRIFYPFADNPTAGHFYRRSLTQVNRTLYWLTWNDKGSPPFLPIFS